MAYYKVRIEVWCDWDPEESDLEEIARHVALGEDAIRTLQEVVKVDVGREVLEVVLRKVRHRVNLFSQRLVV